MSNNYQWFEATQMLQCYSYRACYQLLRLMYKHQFYCVSELVMGNTRIFQLHKCNTDIIIYVYNELRDPLSNKIVSYADYINSLKRSR